MNHLIVLMMINMFEDYLRIDTHVHIKADYRGARMIEPEQLAGSLEKYNIAGAVVLLHSNSYNYEKDFLKVKKFCEDYSNMIPAVEVTNKSKIKVGNQTYRIKCHLTSLGQIPKEDHNYGSWYTHVTKTGGLFKEAEKHNIESEFITFKEPSIVESTSDLFEALSLRVKNHISLLGTDAHPDKNFNYNYLGKKGLLIKANEFNYEVFMNALKNQTFGYFSQFGNNCYYITLDDFLQKNMVIKKV
jgi:hypothetical protein